MEYLELRINDVPQAEQDILTGLLANTGFESFIQEGVAFLAYVPADLYLREEVMGILASYSFTFTEKVIPEKNWNEEWEKNFLPVAVAGKCFIRAPFHASEPGYLYEIIIEPKMSFGTAHHETTALMMELMLSMDFEKKEVLDMGCGTGILAILAAKMGASPVLAIDNDEWAFNNTLENIERNSVQGITAKLGDIGDASGTFDCILANINRNILLEQIPVYSMLLRPGATLLMSGFYEEDLPLIRECSDTKGLALDTFISKNLWVAVRFRK
jgi:ribosomal protein L11 methyltransferase